MIRLAGGTAVNNRMALLVAEIDTPAQPQFMCTPSKPGARLTGRVMKPFLIVGVLSAFVIGCGKSLVTPTPTIPHVAGAYAGGITLVYPDVPRTLTCPATTTVTQSGSLVSLAPLVLSGQCGSVSVPLGQLTIDATGSFLSQSGSLNEPSCGVYNYVASGGFFGREFRLSMNATSQTCARFNFSTVLTR